MKEKLEEGDKEKVADLKIKHPDEGNQDKTKQKWNGEDTVDEKDYNFLLQIKEENLGNAIWWDKENELVVSGSDAFVVAHKEMIEVQVIEAMLKMVQEEYGVKGGKHSVTHQSAMSMSLIDTENVEATQMYVAEPFYKNSQEYAFTLLPVFVQDGKGGHWSLLVYNRDDKEFFHYNSIKPKNPESIGSKTEQTAAKYRKFLVQNVMRKINPSKEDKYVLTNVDSAEQEPRSVDCGVFVILWCYGYYRNGLLRQKTYAQKLINEGRAMIVRKLLRSKYSHCINMGKSA